MNADYITIRPCENIETVTRAFFAGLISHETAVHKLFNIPETSVELLRSLGGDGE